MSGAPNCSIDAMHEALLVKRTLQALADYPALRPVMYAPKCVSKFPSKWRIRVIVKLAKSKDVAREVAVATTLLDIAAPIDVMLHLGLVKPVKGREDKMRRLLGMYNKMNNSYSVPEEFREVEDEWS